MDEELKKRYESLLKENIRLRDNFNATQQAYTRVVSRVNSLELKIKKIQQEKDKLAQQLVDGNSDKVYIKNCDNLTINL